MNKKALEKALWKYVKAATKRFAKKSEHAEDDPFVNGFSWGAHAGYLAGLKAAKRLKRV